MAYTLSELTEQIVHDAFVRYCEGNETEMRLAYLSDSSTAPEVLEPLYRDALARAVRWREAIVHLPNYAVIRSLGW